MIKNYLIAIILGASLTLAFAPFHIWPISFIAILLLIYLLTKQRNTKNSFYLGFYFGIGFFATNVSWIFVSIYKYGDTNSFLALLITSLFIIFLALFPAINLYLLKKSKLANCLNWRLVIGFPASWTLLEIFRGWFLTGFPWSLLGYTQMNSLLKYYASLGGIFGVSFVVALISSLFSHLLFNFKKNGKIKNFITINLILFIFISPKLFYNFNNNLKLEQPIKVAIIQSNITPDDKFLYKNSIEVIKKVSEDYWQPTKHLKNVDLVIWPENSIPLEAENYVANNFLYSIDQFTKNNNFSLLVGIPIQHKYKSNYFYNAVLALGHARGVYYKTNLVPFGDYVPLENLFRGLINFFNLPLSSFIAGNSDQEPIVFNGRNLLATVCYDIAYAEDLRVRVLKQNPGVIVTISEDGWFGDSFGPKQHLDLARMRAIETNRYVLRATTSGISAIIDNQGNIVKQTPQFKKITLIGEYKNGLEQTFWTKTGNKLIVGLLLICIIFILL